ncbi:MAG: histidine kinase [Micrococcaceae bacterium]
MSKPHTTLKQWASNHPVETDALWVVPFFLTIGLPEIFSFTHPHESAPTSHVPALVAILVISFEWLPMIWRRKHTAIVGLVVAAANFIHIFVNMPVLPTNASAAVMIYSMAVYCTKKFSRIALVLGLLGAIYSAISSHGISDDIYIASLEEKIFWGIFQSSIVLLAWVSGNWVSARRAVLQELKDKATRLEFEKEQERKLAGADERSRIAREMHDIIAHSLSVIIAQADGARYIVDKEPDTAAHTLGVISETGRHSLQEMRKLIGILRSDEEIETTPAPSLAELPELVETTKLSGLEIDFQETGRPSGTLSSGASLTAYRIFQEAFTNILKHAGLDAKATAHLAWNKDGIWMKISDDGLGSGNQFSKQLGSQQGICGMKERASLYDGWVKAGPKATGGFEVESFIPYSKIGIS